MKSGKFDVAVIGGGHNGLTTAALLAKGGRKVIVLERRSVLGGLGAGEEFHPGFRSPGLLTDTSGVWRSVADTLGLASRHGLRFKTSHAPVLAASRAGAGLLLHRDPAQAALEISRHSPRDAERYAEFRATLERLGGFFRKLQQEPVPDATTFSLGATVQLAKKALSLRMLGRADMIEVLRIAPMCAADWLNEWFETPLLKAALAGPSVYGTFSGPWSPGTNMNLLFREALAGPPIEGGPQALVRALEAAAREQGVEIRTGAEVSAIVLEGGAVRSIALAGGESLETGAVAASCDPRRTFLDLLPRDALSMGLEHRVQAFRVRGTTAKMNLALSGALEFRGRGGSGVEYARTGEELDDLEKAFDCVKYGELPARPCLEIFVPTAGDPSFAPRGSAVASILVHFAPRDLRGGWTSARKRELADRVLAELESVAPGAAGKVVGSEILSPEDIEWRYGISGGHVHHGEHALDQYFARPTPECAAHATPVPGLYVCGSGSHPGGGITCGPGALAAAAILKS